MMQQEIEDSIKSWYRERLKNSYFTSVAVVWIITNRVLVFGIFNFDNEQTLKNKIEWIHYQLQHNKVYPFKIFGSESCFFEGFYPTILYCFILGIVTMLFFKYLNAISKWINSTLGKWAIKLIQNIAPQEWIHRKDVDALIRKNDQLKDLAEKYEKENEALRLRSETSQQTITDLNKRLSTLEVQSIQGNADTPDLYSSGMQNASHVTIQQFIDSDYSKYFKDIVSVIQQHHTFNTEVISKDVIDYYTKIGLIAMKDNLFILTDLGNKYYRAYLNYEEPKPPILPKPRP
jgi:hypothetical protein